MKSVRVKLDDAKHVIGRNGATINSLQTTHHVNITSKRDTEHCHYSISGKPDDVEAAHTEIQSTIRKAEEYREKPQTCRFYLRNECTFGDKCRYEHPLRNSSKRKHSPSPNNREKSTTEHRPDRRRNPEPRPLGNRQNDNRTTTDHRQKSDHRRSPDRRRSPTRRRQSPDRQRSPDRRRPFNRIRSPNRNRSPDRNRLTNQPGNNTLTPRPNNITRLA